MSETKIVLSDKELEMVNDREWILTKQRIIQQVYVLFESVVADIDLVITPRWQALSQQQAAAPRIFRGENYLGLPYVTLDHPRLFNAENSLTVRTMFWWGNFVSVTLHAGAGFINHVTDHLRIFNPNYTDLYVCINENQWHHHFETTNYLLLRSMTAEQLAEIRTKDFIKIAYKIPLQQFNELPGILRTHYKFLAEIMISFRGDEKAL